MNSWYDHVWMYAHSSHSNHVHAHGILADCKNNVGQPDRQLYMLHVCYSVYSKCSRPVPRFQTVNLCVTVTLASCCLLFVTASYALVCQHHTALALSLMCFVSASHRSCSPCLVSASHRSCALPCLVSASCHTCSHCLVSASCRSYTALISTRKKIEVVQ